MTNTDNALTIISNARSRGALIYSAPNLNTPPMYKVEVTEIASKPEEFHNIQGKYMPSKAVLDRIADAAGINFLEANCNVTTETRDDPIGGKRTVFIGRAQGKVRISDGSWREGTVEEYEFDPILRAKAEGGNESKQLEYMKVGRSRASTGARLRVIRQLTGMPVTLTKDDISKPLLFSRIVQNVDFIMETAEGRQMAVAAAFGAVGSLYGKPAQIEAPAPELRNVTHGDEFEPAPNADAEPDPKLVFVATVKDYLDKYEKNLGPGSGAVLKMHDMVKNHQNYTAEEINEMLGKAKGVLTNLGVLKAAS